MDITYRPAHQLTIRYGQPYATILQAAGHRIVHEGGDVLLQDGDPPYAHWKTQCDRHDKVVLYPHSAGLVADGTGAEPRHPSTRGRLVCGVGEVEMAKVGETLPAVACGWAWTPLYEFTPCENPRNILFAPPHTSHWGWRASQLDAWKVTGRKLLKRFPSNRGHNMLVSEVPHPFDETVGMISSADLVVTGSFTVLSAAVALGKPAVIMQSYRDHLTGWNVDGTDATIDPAIFDRLVDIVRYPFGMGQLEEALTTEASAWREKFIGGPLDPNLVVAAFDTFVED